MNTVYIPTPFLALSDASLLANIRQQITAPPSQETIPWERLPELDAKAIAYKNRLEQLRQERDKNRAEAERLAAFRNGRSSVSAPSEGSKLSGSINFSATSNSSFLQSAQSDSGSSISSNSFGFGASSGGHRRKQATAEAPKKRHSVDTSFIAGNLKMDIFNHDK